MTIRDRGTKKWVSIMYPELAKSLKQIIEEQDYKEKPLVDEQEKKEFNMVIHYALHENLPVEVTYYADHDYKKVSGNIRSIDSMKKIIHLDDDRYSSIRFDDILHISVI